MNNSKLCEIAKIHENRGNIGRAYQCYLEAALAEDDGEAMNALAQMYFEGDYVHESYDKAGKYYGMAYDRKADIEPRTLIIAGSYWEKRAEDKDDDESILLAIKHYQAAADLGVGYGHECLGEVYFKLGEYDKSYEHLLKMEGRNPCGFYYMGRLYDEGHVVAQDRNKAIEFYRKTIECGSQNEEYGEDCHCALAKERLKELSLPCQEVQ